MLKACTQCRVLKSSDHFVPKRGTTPTVRCINCRDIAAKFSKSEKGKKYMKNWSKSEKAKKIRKKHRDTDKWKATRARHKSSQVYADTNQRYIDSGRYAEVKKAEYERVHSDPARNLEHGIGVKIGQMLRGRRKSSETIMSITEFASRDDLLEHLKSTFKEGMSVDNFGVHRPNEPRKWQLGHRIARAYYSSDPEDVRRCWKAKNLFAQWGAENLSLGVKIPDDITLLAIRDCWPLDWGDVLPSLVEKMRLERACVLR